MTYACSLPLLKFEVGVADTILTMVLNCLYMYNNILISCINNTIIHTLYV